MALTMKSMSNIKIGTDVYAITPLVLRELYLSYTADMAKRIAITVVKNMKVICDKFHVLPAKVRV
ncbi:unannotated protein [freshwater metagenome]|uniref:Unannotated protein n=1 Tax=freshwater metagenome TaxID=449393 RepID=A0A6J7Q9H9_9ZZZZ